MDLKISYYSNSQKFLYDFQHLIRAFFPNEEVGFGKDGELCFESTFEGLNIKMQVFENDKQLLLKNFVLTEDEHESKRIFGRNLYDILKSITKQELPWGILTGIRPSKIAYDLIQSGRSDKEILEFLKGEYYILPKKAELLLEVAKNELEILKDIKSNFAALYIGIPICPTRCLYCSFSCDELNYRIRPLIKTYTNALLKELERVFALIKEREKQICAVYIGGGSPAVLGVDNVRMIFDNLFSNLPTRYIKEVTFEAGRPDTIDEKLIEYLSSFNNINMRLCINPQTSHDKTLKIIGRNHTFDDIKRAFELSKNYCIENINSDVILGLPNETKDDFKKTIIDVLSLDPTSITIHTLSIKRSSLLRFKWQEYCFMDKEDVNHLLDWAKDILKSAGYSPYYMYRQKNMIGNFENVGYSKKGFEGLYNVMMMQEKHDIYACGAKAVSKFIYENNRIERVFNPADINLYISRVLG